MDGLADDDVLAAGDVVQDECEAFPTLESLGLTPGDLETCIKVLDRLKGDLGTFNSKPLKSLRTAMQPFLAELRGKYFRGLSVEEHEIRKAALQKKAAREQAARAHDRNAVQSAALREQRLKQLERLQHDSGLRLIPDGPACIGAGASGAIEDAQGQPVADCPPLDSANDLHQRRVCYTCKKRFWKVHHFYSDFCPECAELNYKKRMQSANLTGRVALVTGARVKIGFQVCLKLLRCGASVIATTRFPHDAAKRFAQCEDFASWSARLHMYGLDLRDLPAIEVFTQWLLQTYGRLDVIINNACQTVRRPPQFFSHLMSAETSGVSALPAAARKLVQGNVALSQAAERARTTHAALQGDSAGTGIANESSSVQADSFPAVDPSTVATAATILQPELGGFAAFAGLGSESALMSQTPILSTDVASASQAAALFPPEALDAHDQQVDLRRHHSWMLKLDEIETPEAVEVFAINTLAPFIINAKLKPLLVRSMSPDRYIINVSAMEGKFYRFKSVTHPHTNMAKAALNMMTRTSGSDYAKAGIYMNSVDTGWINDEKPIDLAINHAEAHNFQTPIDEVDAAARILDPVMVGINDSVFLFGKFLKDYAETEW